MPPLGWCDCNALRSRPSGGVSEGRACVAELLPAHVVPPLRLLCCRSQLSGRVTLPRETTAFVVRYRLASVLGCPVRVLGAGGRKPVHSPVLRRLTIRGRSGLLRNASRCRIGDRRYQAVDRCRGCGRVLGHWSVAVRPPLFGYGSW